MATTVSHAMRRYPATPPDNKYNNFGPLRTSDSSPALNSQQELSSPSGGSALSRSMRYAEPWLYGSVRGAPVLVATAFPSHAGGVGLVSTPLLHLCSCPEYVNGTISGKTKNSKGVCKKCKGQRLTVGNHGGKQKYGTVRGYSTSTPNPALTSIRAGTVRVTASSRASILPPSPSIDPYDLMRRSRLSCPDVGSQFRARSTSPSKSRSNLDLRNYSSTRTKTLNPKRTRSPSPPKNSVSGGRRSILECDVNPYELMSTDNNEAKKSVNQNGKSNGFKNYLNNDYEDVETTSKNTSNKLISQIPKLQNKLKKSSPTSNSSNRRSNERENHIMRNEAKFKSILKKPTTTFGDTDLSSSVVDNSSGSKSGSHFYLPMPTLTPPRKKVQFLVENETEEQFEGNNDRMESNGMRDEELASFTSPPAVAVTVGATLESKGNADLVAKESIDKESNEIHHLEDLDNEPCRLKRSLSERLIHEIPNISFNDTMALRNPRNRSSVQDHVGSTLFDAVTDLQRLDGISLVRSRPREPPPPPPPPSPPSGDLNDRPATPPPRSVTELGSGYDVAVVTENTKKNVDIAKTNSKKVEELKHKSTASKTTSQKGILTNNTKKLEEPTKTKNMEKKVTQSHTTNNKNNVENKPKKEEAHKPNNSPRKDELKVPNEDTPPSVPPRKRSNSKQPLTAQVSSKKEDTAIQNKTKSTLKEETVVQNDIPKQIESPDILMTNNEKSKNIEENKEEFKDDMADSIYEDYDFSKRKETPKIEENPFVFETSKITIKSSAPANENISSTKIESPDGNYSYQKVTIEPSKTIVQINSPKIQVIPSTVHRLQIKNEFSENVNCNTVSINENPQRKTSIMINGDDCYSTVNVNDDVPIYQSSVVVNDYEPSKIEISSGNKSSSVYITGDFQSNSTPLSSRTSKSEERPKKTLVILDGNSFAPSTPSPTLMNGRSANEQSTPEPVGKTFVILQEEMNNKTPSEEIKETTTNNVEKRNKVNNKLSENDYEKPSSEELQRLLKDPVEAVKRNLVPHVCGKADVERKSNKNRKSITSNSLVARLLEDPFLGSLAEGLETNTVAKLIEDSLIKLRSQDFQDDDKDVCSENELYPPYELMEAGSDCYSNHSNRSSVTEDELGTRSKFYQLLADAALSEIEDHHYECIKPNNVDPIYEEIEIPPPLPSNPPPPSIIDDLQIDKQFTTRSIFEGASKYDILSYLVDAKERGIVPEESYTYNFNNSGDVIVEEEEESKGRGVFSSRVSHMSTVSDSSEDSSLVITAEKNGPQKSAEVERNDSGVGSETSKCSRSRYLNQPEASIACEDCDLAVDPQPEDGPLVCKKCSKKRSERKEIITEIVETEEKYSRDLQIILEEFYQPMLVAGLLTPEQLSAIFLNVEELLENSQALAERLRDTLEIALEQGDEDLLTVNIGRIFLEAAPMLHAFESYCVRQGPASLLLAGLEKEKELLRIFLRVSQMENTVLRRMNLNSFLMVPVQRVTKYPLLLARLHKVTPLHQESRDLLREAQHKIELHLSHMNSETKDVPSKLWRRISNNSGRRSSSEMDLVNIKLRKIAVDVLEWNHDEARFALEGRLLFTQPTDNNWRKGRTIKLTPVNALLVTNGKPNSSPKSDRNGTNGNNVLSTNGNLSNEDGSALTFPRQTGVREAALLLVRDKGGRYSLLREPLYLDRCVIATDPAWQSYFEVQELLGKDTFIFKAEDAEMTRTWYRQLQYHAQGMGAWRKRRNALANIMINGMGSRS